MTRVERAVDLTQRNGGRRRGGGHEDGWREGGGPEEGKGAVNETSRGRAKGHQRHDDGAGDPLA